jgi:hypothetical protein
LSLGQHTVLEVRQHTVKASDRNEKPRGKWLEKLDRWKASGGEDCGLCRVKSEQVRLCLGAREGSYVRMPEGHFAQGLRVC